MPRRPPRLPMLLGLATLTAGAHVLAAFAHMFGGHADWRDWPFLSLLALAPLASIALAMLDRPRHGAGLLVLTMGAAALWTLQSHYALLGDTPDPPLYAWLIHMTLAFELQGVALGALLLAKPQVPRAKAEAADS